MPRRKRSRRKQATRESNNKISEEMKAAGSGPGSGPTICLFVEHYPPENSSLYVIRLPIDLSELEECEQMFDVYDCKQNITTISPFLKECTFLPGTSCVNLGSKFYFFGGASKLDADPLSRHVQFIDINDPQPELRSVASMHTAKTQTCVFVDNGMIYAFAPHPIDCTTKFPGYNYTGLFERYKPLTDCWEILPDPPLFDSWAGIELLDCATVIGRRVIIGVPCFLAIFDLDSLTWDNTLPPPPRPPRPRPERVPHFPYGSIFSQQSDSLYRLSGFGVPRITLSQFDRSELIPAVRKFSLPPSDTLMNHSFTEEQMMAEAKDLDENKSFTKSHYYPKRFFFHVGGRFFCYVVTAHLFDQLHQTQVEMCSRAFFIKFFEDVPAGMDNSKGGTVFRTVASFCYKTDTTFPNVSHSTRCSVIGTVPDCWINSPPKKKQESKFKSVNKEMNSMILDLSRMMRSVREKCLELGKTENGDRGTEELKKLIAAHEAEIGLLKAELAMVKAGAGSTSS
ncbi:uncharacterized protein LOC141598573 [Silene latifolia]|uniref:uncharacterized protein LOC141598573 n=1 Tax=Silene latifolia TaxID=37657 RepID=UPI003D777E92